MNNTNQTDSRKWSDQQEAIFAEFRDGRNNVVVRARAGTGKTTTILRAIDFAPESRILLAAFNKKIAEELKTKLQNPKAEAKTLHSIGFGLVLRNWRGVKLNDDRGSNLARAAANRFTPNSNAMAPNSVVAVVAKLASLAKGSMPFAGVDGLMELALNNNLGPDEAADAEGWTTTDIARAARVAMDSALKFDGTLDFDDMVFVPVANRWARGVYDLVVVDEAQDMNASQLLLAQGVAKKNGRVVVVGDDRQAIYGFRGADSGSIDRLKTELKAIELGLTITYRCPKKVVAMAQALVPDYQAADTAPEGEVAELDYSKLADEAKEGSFVLSRKNAPLGRICLSLLRRGTRARIEGRDIGATLLRVVRDLKLKNLSDLDERLEVWAARQDKRAAKLSEKAALAAREMIADQKETIKVLSEGLATVAELNARIETLFTEVVKGQKIDFVVCSSIHRSKGLEADTVYLFTETLYPGGRRDTEEQNIEYVAITRAKRRLVLVTGLEKKTDE